MGLRKIQPIDIDQGMPIEAVMTADPEFAWVDPRELWIDDAYQRTPTRKSLTLIRNVVGKWEWAKFKPPVCVRIENGYECIDGQHTAIAAATSPFVAKIPIMIVQAPSQAARADAFVGQNKNRTAITNMQMHRAAVAAGQDDALTVQNVCDKVGVRLTEGARQDYKVGDTLAIGAVYGLVSRRHPHGARQVLALLVEGGLAPIGAADIKAVDALLFAEEFKGTVKEGAILRVLREDWPRVLKETAVFAATHRLPNWKALTSCMFKAVRRARATG